jgi:carbon monoxide dehydrogenase subunit G
MQLTFRVQRDLEHVFACLSEADRFVSVHPVISRMEATSDDTFRVYETLRFGFIPFSFRYTATVTPNPSEKTIVVRATVFRLTRIVMHFRLRREPTCTVVDEEIVFSTPLPVVFLMKRVFREQHEQLFRNIETM